MLQCAVLIQEATHHAGQALVLERSQASESTSSNTASPYLARSAILPAGKGVEERVIGEQPCRGWPSHSTHTGPDKQCVARSGKHEQARSLARGCPMGGWQHTPAKA